MTVDSRQLDKVKSGLGFIAALDQSGGSTPGALAAYGIPPGAYAGNDQMFGLMHAMRSRIMQSPSFGGDHVIGAILFADTLDRQVAGRPTAEYLWATKSVVPFLKVDEGLEPERDGAQVMKPVTGLVPRLDRARDMGVFGTKMRSFIKHPNREGVDAVVAQQFDLAGQILGAGLVPVLEPEIDIHSTGKAEAELLLRTAVLRHLAALPAGRQVMLKVSLPDEDDFYSELVDHPSVLRVVALSGGYSQKQANDLLARNHGVIASFSRALTEGLSVDQSDEAFDAVLEASVEAIYQASVT
jgi:fructose-bisphosphate aldolase class I